MKRFHSILLAFAMVFALAGCGTATDDGTEKAEKTAAPAPVQDGDGETETDYKEKSVEYPEGTVFYSTYDADGTPVAILFDEEKYKQSAAYEEYLYRDGIWEKQDTDALNEVLKKEGIASLSTLDKDASGKRYALGSAVSGGEDGKGSASFYEFTDKKAVKYEDVVFRRDDNIMYQYQLLGDGKLCALYADGSICTRKIGDGEVEKDLGSGFAMMGVAGNRLFAASQTGDSIREFSLETGEQEHEYPVKLTNRGVAFCQDGEENAYVCTENGIFLLNEDDEKLEEVVGEGVMSVNAREDSSVIMLSGMRVKDGTFNVTYVVQGENSRKYRMFEYHG